METYRDHPLAFLCGRTSPRSLQARADDWRKKKFEARGIDVAGIFDRAASNLAAVRVLLGDALTLVLSEADIDGIANFVGRVEVDFAVAAEAIETAQYMRQHMLDPYGGSVCASLEMAWEELRHVGGCIESAIVLAETTGSHSGMEKVLLDALDMVEKPVVTHEAPRSVM
jgi:hypothetical protein